MNGLIRVFLTLLAAGATGALLWCASQFDRGTTGGYWAAMGVIAAGGLLFGLAQLSTAALGSRAAFLLAFVPIGIATL